MDLEPGDVLVSRPWEHGSGVAGQGQFPPTQTQYDRYIEAAAEALWLDASKERFGGWTSVDEKVKELWRKSARAAFEAISNVGD
jgi:hypothetical protein